MSNAVLVKKGKDKWRMCIDFRDLNKAGPKDYYLLPRIDQLVDSTGGCEMLSMMDASQGYHQILLDREDQDKVSFITSSGTYCYRVMPFGLKNAGATYQRPVDKMFHGQIGSNLEIYVDDTLVKSTKAQARRRVPFFKILRQGTEFSWDKESAKAFEKLKNVLASLPLLAKPEKGERLYVYL